MLRACLIAILLEGLDRADRRKNILIKNPKLALNPLNIDHVLENI